MPNLVQRIYWCVWLLALATAGLSAAETSDPPAWSQRYRNGDVVYFTFATPARLERFDLAQERWLPSVSLTSSPTALYVDNSGIYLAHGRALVRRALDGTNEQPLHNTATDINGVLGDSSFLFVFTPSGGQSNIASLRKTDGQLVSTWSTYYSLSAGYSIAPNNRRIYGVNTYTSSFSTIELNYTATGTFGTAKEAWSDTGSYYENSRTFVFPNEGALVRHNGIVYNLPGLSFRASLAGAFDDAGFHGSDVLIVLRGNKLVAFANTLLESGTATLASAAQAIAVRSGQVFAFSRNAGSSSGIAFAKVAVSSITAAQPGAPIDPNTLKYVPDDVIPVGDGTFLYVSKRFQSVFRWSAIERRYTASFPLLGAPEVVAYSSALNRLYVGYSSGRINQIKFDAGQTTEEPFANLPLGVQCLQTAGDLLLAADESGAWLTHYVFAGDGSLKSSKEWSEYSRAFVWSPTLRRMFHFRDGSSPNDLHYEVITVDGQITTRGETPYHGDYTMSLPIRLSSDETGVLIGSGVLFSSTDLKYAGALANSITDAVSQNNRWITIRTSGDATQLQTWTTTLLFDRGLTIPGAPFRVLALPDGKFLVLTTSSGRLVTSIVDLAGAGTVSTSPLIATEPANVAGYIGRDVTLSVKAEGTALAYQWSRNGAVIAGATSSTYTITNAQASQAGLYTVTITNAFGSVVSSAATVSIESPPPAPVIVTEPTDQVVMLGGTLSLGVNATGAGPLTYQWSKDGTAIAGATNSGFYKSSLTAADLGGYRVAVTNDGGSVTSRVAVVSLPVRAQAFATRFGLDARGADVFFHLEGGTARTLLIRVLGPALAALGVSAPASDPKLELYDSLGVLVGANDQWGTAPNAATLVTTAQQVGGIPLEAGSKDAAILLSVRSGVNTLRISLAGGAAGPVVVEVFDLAADLFPRIAYFGARAPLTAGTDGIATGVGFSGAGTKSFLVRGLGPALLEDGALADPMVGWSRAGTLLAANNDWGTSPQADALVQAGARFGGLPLATGSRDAALLTGGSVLAGGYVAQLAGESGSGWAVLELIDTDGSRPLSQPPILVVPPKSQTVLPGKDLTLAVRAAGTPPFTYVWRKDGAQIVGANQSAILLRAAQASDSGSYTVTVSNTAGSTTSVGARIQIDSTPPPSTSAAAIQAAPLYVPGATLTISNVIVFPNGPTSVGWAATLPAGWSYAGGSGEGDIKPAVGATGTLEWAWSTPPTSPLVFTYRVNVPATEVDARQIAAQVVLRYDAGPQSVAVTPASLSLFSAKRIHSADTDRDSRIGLGELLRVIQLYNTRVGSLRTGQYRELPGTEDGFAPDPTESAAAIAVFHAADLDRNGRISLAELTRMIELYNSRQGTQRTGQYHADSTTDDGFATGP